MRASIKIIFVKSTLFKGRIIFKTSEGMKENMENWGRLAKQLGYFEKKK